MESLVEGASKAEANQQQPGKFFDQLTGKGKGEPDFRHIGLMHSDDEGRNWTFDRWVITSEDVIRRAARIVSK